MISAASFLRKAACPSPWFLLLVSIVTSYRPVYWDSLEGIEDGLGSRFLVIRRFLLLGLVAHED
jgi:hypothetical protein